MRNFTKFFLSLMAMLMVTVSASAWKFTLNSPAEGEVSELGQIVLNEPAGTMWVDEFGAIPVNLVDGSGNVVAVYNMGDNFSAQVTGSPMDPVAFTAKEIKDPGTYTMTIPAGSFHINGEGNEEFKATWTIKGADDVTPPAKEYTVSYADGTITIAWPEGTVINATDFLGSLHPQIIGYDGFVSAGMYNPSNKIEMYVTLAPGEYTLVFPAGDFTVNNAPNAAFSETFTVGGGTQGGEQEFDGEKYHETIFKAGETSVTTPIAFETDGVTITTIGREFSLGGETVMLNMNYNTNGEKEINWTNGTKFVFTAKKDINKIIFVPTADSKSAIAFATAEGGNGSYENGVWEGKLATGETLTLTSNDGINIKEFYICYNGDDFDPQAGIDEKGVITIEYPVENQLIAGYNDGGKICEFTTNKEYAQVTIEIKNSNEAYDNLYKFTTLMIDNLALDSNNNPIIKLKVGKNIATSATPDGKYFSFFKGDSYTMIVKGYVNMWDGPDDYDAMAEVNFVGDGIEHTAESIVKLLNITPATSFDEPAKIAMKNGVVTLEFDAPVTKVTAITPGGQTDPTINYVATPKAGSDNKVWEINLGDRSGFASADTDGDPIIEIDITAEAEDGIVILSDERADRGLVLKYILVNSAEPTKVVTLGTPVWSIEEGAEIEASTSSINIKFPNAENVEGTYTLEVSGTIGDKNLNLVNVSATGTIADGVDIPVTLAENIGYNLTIGTIVVKNGDAVVYSTDMGNYQLNFGTKAAQGGEEQTGVTVKPSSISEGALFVEVNGIASVLNGELTADHYLNIGNATVDGNPDFYQLGMIFGGEMNSPQRITSWNALADGTHTVIIPAGQLEIAYWPFSEPTGTTLYQNNESIVLTFEVKDGKLVEGAVEPTPDPDPQPQVSSVVIYEEGVDTHTSNTELNFSKDGVTLTSETTGSAFVISNFKPGISGTHLRLFPYNTLKFSAERNIKKIEFVPAVASAKYQAKSVSTGSFEDNVWTGEATDVDMVLNGTNMDILKIVVYFEETVEPTPDPTPDPEKEYTVSYNDGTVTVEWPEGTKVEASDFLGSLHPQIIGYEGYVAAGLYAPSNKIEMYVTLAPGEYTLVFPAGDFTVNNVPNAEFSETFTVGGGTQGGEEEFDGDKFHETIFKSGETVPTIPFVVDNDNVSISTVGRAFLDTTIDVGYDMYETKELNWKNGTKFVITAKKDINKVIFVPTADSKTAIAYAAAEGGNGSYDNGVWEGKLAAGETLTLTANDGINIEAFYICYNGDDFDPTAGSGDDKGVITVQWPLENQGITQITDGGILAKFTTTKKYDQVTIELRNVNETYHNLYDLPVRYMDQLPAGEHTCTTSTPGTSDNGGNAPWIPYNGDAYELIIKGYVSYYDSDYDAMIVVPVHGESAKEHETLSAATLVKITPTTATETSMDTPKAKVTNLHDNTVTFEFSDKLSKLDAVRGGSLIGGLSELKLAATTDDEGKIWTVTIPASDIQANCLVGEDYNIEITAYDAEGNVLDLNDRRADHALAVIFEVTDQDITEDDVKTLGTPAFSIEDGAENVPATTNSILVTFPEAKGFGENAIAKVSGVLACRDMSTPVEFTVEGTLAAGISVPVELTEDKGYLFTINSVSLSEKITVNEEEFINPIGTYNGPWNLTFFVAKNGGEEEVDDILGGEPVVTADETGITISFPNADFSKVEDMGIEITSVKVTAADGNVYEKQYASFDLTNGLVIKVSYDEIYRWNATWTDMIFMEAPKPGDVLTVTIPAYNLSIYHDWNDFTYTKFGVAYQNEADIVATVTVPQATGINAATSVIANDKIYNISGQQIKVAKGIVIKNGKKYYVK